MAGSFQGTTIVDRPVQAVFDYLAAGTNDKDFSPRVQEIRKTTEAPVEVGTVFASTVKDAGMKTKREIEITEYVAPIRIRWVEKSKNLVTSRLGGYDLESLGESSTRVTIFNELEGHGVGKLLVGFAVKQAQKGADEFAASIKRATESHIPAA